VEEKRKRRRVRKKEGEERTKRPAMPYSEKKKKKRERFLVTRSGRKKEKFTGQTQPAIACPQKKGGRVKLQLPLIGKKKKKRKERTQRSLRPPQKKKRIRLTVGKRGEGVSSGRASSPLTGKIVRKCPSRGGKNKRGTKKAGGLTVSRHRLRGDTPFDGGRERKLGEAVTQP